MSKTLIKSRLFVIKIEIEIEPKRILLNQVDFQIYKPLNLNYYQEMDLSYTISFFQPIKWALKILKY